MNYFTEKQNEIFLNFSRTLDSAAIFQYLSEEEKIPFLLLKLSSQSYEIQNEGLTIFRKIFNDPIITGLDNETSLLIGIKLLFCLIDNNFKASGIHSMLIDNYELNKKIAHGFIIAIFTTTKHYHFENYNLLEKAKMLIELFSDIDRIETLQKIISIIDNENYSISSSKEVLDAFDKILTRIESEDIQSFFISIMEYFDKAEKDDSELPF